MEDNDVLLLERYSREGCEQSFAAVVSRHINMVYSIALRQTRNPSLAEDIVQSVFLLLAQKAPTFSPKVLVAGWLCRTTRHVCQKVLTSERRRLRREGEAHLQSQANQSTQEEDWRQIAPLLDDAMAKLEDKDYDALVLRFFLGRSFGQVGRALGTSEAAAKMRVGRALERLSHIFSRRGLTVSALAVASTLSVQSLQAAPAGLGVAVVAATLKAAADRGATHLAANALFKAAAGAKLHVLWLAASIAVVTASVVLITSHRSPEPALGFSFKGYATPEAAIQSVIWAASQGDSRRFAEGITPEELQRFLNRARAESLSEVQNQLMSWAKGMASYHVVRKTAISDHEVLIGLGAAPSQEALIDGGVTLRLVKFGNSWRQAGQGPQTSGN